MRVLSLLLLTLLFSACVKHEQRQSDFKPVTNFSGRLLVMDQNHRFQVEVDWQGNEESGILRLTHAMSGRVIYVSWREQTMLWHDNDKTKVWQPLSEQALLDMGIILPPWVLVKVFAGEYPNTMHTKDHRLWKGVWGDRELTIKWASQQQRLELVDFKHGKRAVIIFNES